MTSFDVFNGDADGICALTQLRLASPREAVLVTGVKRDIQLLDRVWAAAGDQVTVLDVSMDKNRASLDRQLAAGAEVFYVDHHFAGEIPAAPRLRTLINEAPDVCTSLLVNGHLQGRFARWAVVGAYGDNLRQSAQAAARQLDLTSAELALLEELGTCINYNGYGERVEDLHYAPDELFLRVSHYADPLDFIRDDREHFERLHDGYHEDMRCVEALVPLSSDGRTAVYILPDQPWARRVSGVYGNQLSNRYPERAHAVLTPNVDGGYVVSVRAPLANKVGAADLCRQFLTGGGRAAAAGINHLPTSELDNFIARLRVAYR
ncbi:DHH family phosphoesterase [Pseudomonas nicosulfuronedens]|uniref:DHH family phosphoesterase n=1 Tax=Pseudomonas nicosulfuronedens TaxID=2571105 RepID=A0A5R9QNM0_9PSED|nr:MULTISPECIES: DHHA1 domain-containing protein [Pseudomonas]TLX70621.1 DHH family phosphoesterase [Pseudomonas nicosulfuronedens]